MAEPVRKVFERDKESLTEEIKEALGELNLETVGYNRELGILSFRDKKGTIYYAHLTPVQGKEETEIAVAPGLPKLKERDPSEYDGKIIEKLLSKIGD